MKTKVSRAQTEVWEWKRKAYEEVKHLPLKEQIKQILLATQPLAETLRARRKKNLSAK